MGITLDGKGSEMKDIRTKVESIIKSSIDDLNKYSQKPVCVDDPTEFFLTGPKRSIDSLALVNLVVSIEEKIECELRRSLSLLGEETVLKENGPLTNLSTLLEYITGHLERPE
jgi:acyl carrier protein